MKFFELLKECCQDNGLACEVSDDEMYAIIMRQYNGLVFPVLSNRFPLNMAVAARISGDKGVTKSILNKNQILNINGKVFDLKMPWDSIFEYFEKLKYIAIIKPIGGERGENVFLVKSYGQLAYALSILSRFPSSIIMEQFVSGREFRIFIIDNKVEYLIERHHHFLTGNGTSKFIELIIKSAPKSWLKIVQDARLSILAGSPPFNKIIRNSEVIHILPCANSSESTYTEIPLESSPIDLAIIINSVKSIGLYYGGVDAILCEKTNQLYIIEINSAPEIEGEINVRKKVCSKLLLECVRRHNKMYAQRGDDAPELIYQLGDS